MSQDNWAAFTNFEWEIIYYIAELFVYEGKEF